MCPALFARPAIVSAIDAGTPRAGPVAVHPAARWLGDLDWNRLSARSTDVRVAQQLSVLGSLPLLAMLGLIPLNVVIVSTALAVGLAAALLAIDLFA